MFVNNGHMAEQLSLPKWNMDILLWLKHCSCDVKQQLVHSLVKNNSSSHKEVSTGKSADVIMLVSTFVYLFGRLV